MNRAKIISTIRFTFVFFISFIVMESIEFVIEHVFSIDVNKIRYAWLAFILIYGFKYHILCCLGPAIWTAYRCHHKRNKCKHKHCDY